MAGSKKKGKRPEISVRTPDPELKERLARIAKKISRPMAQIVRDGVLRELNDIEAHHPVFAASESTSQSQEA